MIVAELEHHLRATYAAAITGDRAQLAIRFADGIEQHVTLRGQDVRGRPWLLAYAEVCRVGEYDHEVALAHAATLAVGALCTAGGRYFLQHALPLAAGLDDLDAVVVLLAHEAARLRGCALLPIPAALPSFMHLAE